jgi:hypothetical protein
MSGMPGARNLTGMSSALIQRLRAQARRATAPFPLTDTRTGQSGQPRLRDYPVARRR